MHETSKNIRIIQDKIANLERRIADLTQESTRLHTELHALHSTLAQQEPVWIVVNRIVDELVTHEDIIETTFREAIISYIVNYLKHENVLTHEAVMIPVIPYIESREHHCVPCREFYLERLWDIFDVCIEELVENQDLVETTMRKYIIRFFIQSLCEYAILNHEKKCV